MESTLNLVVEKALSEVLGLPALSLEEAAVQVGASLASACSLDAGLCAAVVHSALVHLQHDALSTEDLTSRIISNLRHPQLV